MTPVLNDDVWPEALDALVAAPDHHTLLFESDVVRVLETRILPGSRTPVHTHRWPGVLYVLSWSACVRRDAQDQVIMDSRTMPHVAQPHQAHWSPPLAAHSLENVGDIVLRVISMELKHAAG